MELYYTALSDVGNVRTNNEDYLFAGQIRDGEYLFIVADGMGGHKAGEVASRKAVSTFVRSVENGLSANIPADLKRYVLDVNDILLQEGKEHQDKNGMGTTLSVLYIKRETGYIVHVGDSRIYRFPASLENHAMDRLTDDHSFVGRLLKDGFLTEEEARNHPRRNVLYQSIGLKNEINVQVTEPFPIQKGQKFLLCSDGLYGVVTDEQMAEYLKNGSLGLTARQLVQKAKDNGGPDNITVVLISTEKDQSNSGDTTPEGLIQIMGTLPQIEVEAKPEPVMVKNKNRRKAWFFILVGLLVLLLALTVFMLITSADNDSTRPVPVHTKKVPGVK